ncbi:flagellin N-terminal helical domain-containing protein [Achromobacter xylosoxidans]|jgi:flagellin|uniref:flagellin N-terminal helical domain-containing protein n=1 Tax=Alcaligenes xylosoxydans xylosoxydans TaxID=85698 RepID=UPI0006C70BBF|nr:flagellin [Achromobacter xylosoxidans]QQE59853.1 flagellin FliC [Achromobacter xylosoxidans]QQV13599.1 flagellin FliC [Achromobacter xylosoxidans]UXL03659.1 flagellin [Achromobacter xylosoxidans]CUJ31771.1 Phase 1-I flagellin [Achromobacter xylosoxidans]
MAAVINTNYLSLVAQNNLNKSQSALGTAIERLSSGLRINSAKDDAAGMAIANRFTANVRGLTQASRNANDGISLAQTTEGAAAEITTHLQRVRELAVQAGNGSYSQEQKNSIQDEINQRLADIDRISQQTDFNGVKVLSANAQPLTLQVGANDGETITLNLSEISAKTLGLDGFNVNGSGVTENRSATVSDLQAAGGVTVAANEWQVTTTHAAATADQVFGKLENGNKVTVGTAATGTIYTYDAANKNFTFSDKSASNAATVTTLATSLRPATGTTTGVYTHSNGTSSTSFEVDATGAVKINGTAAFLDAAGNLTTNSAGGTAATLDGVLQAAGGNTAAAGSSSVAINGKTYSNVAGTGVALQFTNTIASDALLANVKAHAAANDVTVTLGSGITSATVNFTAGTSTNTFVDDKSAFTTLANYTTNYAVDPNNGKVTVKSGTGSGDYAPKIGEEAKVSSGGKLTTDATSKGSLTEDPLKTLDAAFTVLNKLTGELGAVQNRLESTIANLDNVVNNLSSARSRIQDADYATEVSNMSRAQILQQAGTSVLAQANQVPQTVLSLLR